MKKPKIEAWAVVVEDGTIEDVETSKVSADVLRRSLLQFSGKQSSIVRLVPYDPAEQRLVRAAIDFTKARAQAQAQAQAEP